MIRGLILVVPLPPCTASFRNENARGCPKTESLSAFSVRKFINLSAFQQRQGCRRIFDTLRNNLCAATKGIPLQPALLKIACPEVYIRVHFRTRVFAKQKHRCCVKPRTSVSVLKCTSCTFFGHEFAMRTRFCVEPPPSVAELQIQRFCK